MLFMYDCGCLLYLTFKVGDVEIFVRANGNLIQKFSENGSDMSSAGNMNRNLNGYVGM